MDEAQRVKFEVGLAGSRASLQKFDTLDAALAYARSLVTPGAVCEVRLRVKLLENTNG